MLVEPRETFPGRLDVLGRDVPDRLSLEDADEPPVRVAVVEQEEFVALDDARLAVDRSKKGVQGVDEVEVDVVVRD